MMMMKFQNDFLNLISFVYFRFEKKQNKTKSKKDYRQLVGTLFRK